MKRFLVFVLLAVFLCPALSVAQFKSQTKAVDFGRVLRYGLSPLGLVGKGLLDSDRFQMWQSYTVSFYSVNGKVLSQGVYLNTMQYRLADPLLLRVQWGFMTSQPLGGFGRYGGRSLTFSRFFISGAELTYRPHPLISLEMRYQAMPYFVPYGPLFYAR